jgi:hypothetical protein
MQKPIEGLPQPQPKHVGIGVFLPLNKGRGPIVRATNFCHEFLLSQNSLDFFVFRVFSLI